MPPLKKPAKKAARKPAAPHKHDKKHQAKDLRRAFEHMGRLNILQRSLKSSSTDTLATLTKLAQVEIASGHNEDAADLLRAAEHFGFAVLAADSIGPGRISSDLEESITDHFDELMRKADKHWAKEENHPAALTAIYKSSHKGAREAFKAGAYHQALEFARAAEALADVSSDETAKLNSGRKTLQLKSA